MSERPDIVGLFVLILFVCIAFAVGQSIGRDTLRHIKGWRFCSAIVVFAFAGAFFLSIFSGLWLGEDDPLLVYSFLGNGIAIGLGIAMRRVNEDG